MSHETDWSRFPPPWNTLGPRLQTAIRQDATRIAAGMAAKFTGPSSPQPPIMGHYPPYKRPA